MARRRPLLRKLETRFSAGQSVRLFLMERLVWERVNEERHGRHLRAFKNFYRHWWKEEEWEWPTSEPFWMQHKRVVKAIHTHGLPVNPLAGLRREDLVAAAVKRLVETSFPENEVAQVLPPVDELLP